MFRIISSIAAGLAFLASVGVQAAPPTVADNAPDSYTVVKGDTLWGISGRFLQEPWRWPEVWEMNEDEIKNPHLIYPGQIVVLDRSGPFLRIGQRIGAGGNMGNAPIGDGKLEPRIYQTPVDEAISTIPLKAIAPFLARPLVVDGNVLEGAATIVATETNRVYLARGDTVFAKDVDENIDKWAIFRPSKPLVDPANRQVIGYEALYLGSAKVMERPDATAPKAGDARAENPVTLEVVEAIEEIGVGDKMLPTDDDLIFSYAPHAPKELIDARLVSIYRGVSEAGKFNVISISAGVRDGLEPGHVLAMFRDRGTSTHERKVYALPEKRYGMAMVFRVFDRVSYALIMDTDGQAAVGDALRNP
ncbi:MAG: LysM peptidoglycan-binding domain-containing protein [Azoarcus sp.]|jgi:hypothetical protein|nr:LysM peptidoglycan-binding domain-containing protein [Azoarcus sp.]